MMIGPDYVRLMARYNAWQNDNLITAADTLDEAARQTDRGAFFGSIFATFNHILWADRAWLSRFGDAPAPLQAGPDSIRETPDWATFKSERAEQDARIAAWAGAVKQAELDGDLTWYSGMLGREFSRPLALCVIHFFNHQTHHRGQIHAILTAAGARPGDTDLILIPDA